MVARFVNKKNAGKPRVLASVLFYTHLLLLLQPSMLQHSIFTFNNDAEPLPKWMFARIWCITNPTPARRVTPPWNVYVAKFDPGWEGYPVWQSGVPSLVDHPTYNVNVIKLKWENIWTGGLPHLNGWPHLPGFPHLHVNRPLIWPQSKATSTRIRIRWNRILGICVKTNSVWCIRFGLTRPQQYATAICIW